jgi:hypothetical protein
VTTALAPAANTASALTAAGVGSGNVAVAFTAGRAVSDAFLTPGGADIGIGDMSAAYGGGGQPLDYTATALFDFTTTAQSEALDLNFSDKAVGVGFNTLDLLIKVVGGTTIDKSFTTLATAEAFFADPISLGAVGAGNQSVSITYDLVFNSGTLAKAGNGFGFTYTLIDPPLGVPELSTWAMMLVGLAGLVGVGSRSNGRKTPFPLADRRSLAASLQEGK